MALGVAVIADDLTGALDAVAAFAEAGLTCVVATSPALLAAALRQGPQVLAVSTNSRELGPDAAQMAVRQAVLGLPAGPGLFKKPVLFKKIDSRLKGNIAAEVCSLAKAAGLDRALICPAIPQMGRIVTGGQLQGFGLDLPLPVAAVLEGIEGLAAQVPDAVSDADIDAILAAVTAGTLLVGARGLSAGLARRMARGVAKPIDLPLPGPLVFVIGSRDPITLAQVAHLRQSQPDAPVMAAPNGVLTGGSLAPGVSILQVTQGAQPSNPALVAQNLATSCQRLFATSPAALVLTGGETAAAVLAAMGVGVLEVLGEALPGMPLCRAVGPQAPLIVTKSGGFGAPEALSLLAGGNNFSVRHSLE